MLRKIIKGLGRRQSVHQGQEAGKQPTAAYDRGMWRGQAPQSAARQVEVRQWVYQSTKSLYPQLPM
jgi:hypothetical protein